MKPEHREREKPGLSSPEWLFQRYGVGRGRQSRRERMRKAASLTGTRLVTCPLKSYGATMAPAKWTAKVKSKREPERMNE